MADLKLLALDQEDLDVISAYTQDAIIKVADMGYVPGDKRFAFLMNRFAWEKGDKSKKGERRRSALHFDNVLSAKSAGFDVNAKDGVLELLTIRFEETDAPSGTITLNFAGGGSVALEVECLEARLADLGAAWRAKAKPAHEIE
ncbi:DUF2948 family protein [Maritalea mediterranea]|uniref:DUF2948 family protein n=1 Tax=Maritalea mediterranea TaxID=2909667 RepID=A0ABS9E481_9HYPH|nr:DUF2948 family protein [Maritalea mediterranea]MCF4097677.1 DUF2948 family protein [Maritalea mediterranea]